MLLDLNKVDLNFRRLTDLLLFSDRKDIDFSEFKSLLKSNYNLHYDYFWNRFLKSSEISWEPEFWNNRIDLLLSISDKNFSKKIEKHIEKRMLSLIKYKDKIDPKYDIEYLQFIEYCKVKRAKKKSFNKIKAYFGELPSYVNHKKIIELINSFIPIVFSSFSDYVELLCKNVSSSNSNVRFLLSAKKHNINFDDSFMVDLFFNLLKNNKTPKNYKHKLIILSLLNDPSVKQKIKEKYNSTNRVNFLKIVKKYSHSDLDESFFKGFKNLLDLDGSILDDLTNHYASQVFYRPIVHKRANIDKICKLIKFVPEITPKRILSWLSTNNKTSEIKYFLSIYPELKKLAAFA